MLCEHPLPTCSGCTVASGSLAGLGHPQTSAEASAPSWLGRSGCGCPDNASRLTAKASSARRTPAAAHLLGHANVTANVCHLLRLLNTSCSLRLETGCAGATRCVQRRLSSGEYLISNTRFGLSILSIKGGGVSDQIVDDRCNSGVRLRQRRGI